MLCAGAVKSDGNHMVALGGLEDMKGLDASAFEAAPAHAMAFALAHVRGRYGSMREYLRCIGFDHDQQRKLWEAMTS